MVLGVASWIWRASEGAAQAGHAAQCYHRFSSLSLSPAYYRIQLGDRRGGSLATSRPMLYCCSIPTLDAGPPSAHLCMSTEPEAKGKRGLPSGGSISHFLTSPNPLWAPPLARSPHTSFLSENFSPHEHPSLIISSWRGDSSGKSMAKESRGRGKAERG